MLNAADLSEAHMDEKKLRSDSYLNQGCMEVATGSTPAIRKPAAPCVPIKQGLRFFDVTKIEFMDQGLQVHYEPRTLFISNRAIAL